MTGRAATVEEYLAEQSLERREVLAAVRRVILENLPVGYAEVMQYCMISYVIPLARYPKTYNKQPLAYISLTVQKKAHVPLPDGRLLRPGDGKLVCPAVPGQRKTARHGQILRALPNPGGSAIRSGRQSRRQDLGGGFHRALRNCPKLPAQDLKRFPICFFGTSAVGKSQGLSMSLRGPQARSNLMRLGRIASRSLS